MGKAKQAMKQHSATSPLDESTDNLCIVCSETIEFAAVGPCQHVVCHRCALRMRLIVKDNTCVVCRADIKEILISPTTATQYSEVKRSGLPRLPKGDAICTDPSVLSAMKRLLKPQCQVCEQQFDTEQALVSHTRKVHELHFCDLCQKGLRLYMKEHQLYTRKELARHRRSGLPGRDAKSFEGHPNCRFCDERFFNNNELYEHLKHSHELCHVCSRTGNPNQYFVDYHALEVHFGKDHFLCREQECLDNKFVVFDTEIDLRAHTLKAHMKNQSRGKTREMRTLNSNLIFGSDSAPAPADSGHSRGGRSRRHQGGMESEPVGYDEPGSSHAGQTGNGRQGPSGSNVPSDLFTGPTPSGRPGPAVSQPAAPQPSLEEAFPALGGGGGGGGRPRPAVAQSFAALSGGARPSITADDFPTLGGMTKSKKSKGKKSSAKGPRLYGEKKTFSTPQAATTAPPVSVQAPAAAPAPVPAKESYPSLSATAGSVTRSAPLPYAAMSSGPSFASAHTGGGGGGGGGSNNGFNAAAAVGGASKDFPGLARPDSSEQWPGLSKPSGGRQEGGGQWGTSGQSKKRGGPKTSPYEFFPPGDMKERNSELMKKMKSILEVGSVKVFKKASGEFRSQEISAEEYYATCQSIFEDRMDEVLQELVALLPDINMQQELAFVHRRANPMGGDVASLSLSTKGRPTVTVNRHKKNAGESKVSWAECPTCHQLLVARDYDRHVNAHIREQQESAFPTLAGGLGSKRSQRRAAPQSTGPQGSWARR